ncbi:hypothetical protein ACLOAU_14475 [Niabella sp. CJ426]|uniref:hypothetical protein n=1 Tax=Niabella sp. CJ426 TaxID=3393740 RepID=UPI003D00D4BF
MKDFKSFNIKPTVKSFEGDKIKIDRVLNKCIVVEDYRIETSKFDKGSGKCLHLQIIVDNSKRVLFTGSSTLMEMIERVPKEGMPFQTTIIKENERFQFS